MFVLNSGVLPGKSIIFAVSHKHAKRIWEIFNRLYPEYKGRLVEIIDSKMERPLKLLEKFTNESFPRVAISVDMLDTGIDIREIVNLVFAKPVFTKIKFWQMIGRGTRTLDEDKIKPWCTEKEKFLIIDHWNNFECFGEKPEGDIPPAQDATPVKIFRVRLTKLRIFQRMQDTQKFERVKTEILNDIKNLPENSITVRENRRNIDKALSDSVWQDFDQKSFEFLEKTIAPLMRFQSNLNLFQAQFVYKTEKLGLALLDNNQEEIKTVRKSIINDIKRLPRNLSSVKEKEEHIKPVLSEEFWQLLDYEKCGYIRENLSEIMKHKLLEEREIVKLDLDDLVIEYNDLFEPPFIQFGTEAATRLFSEEELQEIIDIFNEIPL